MLHGRCACTSYSEMRAVRTANSTTIGDWLYQDFLCRWGALCEIVTDNGAPWLKAVEHVRDKYHIHHIRVSGYNLRANGAIEGPHFHVRQALMKAAQGTKASWQSAVYAVCWADRVTVRRRMGCSPYFAVTGSHPILPFDLAEANCLAPPTDFPISTADLIWQRAEALQNRYEAVQELRKGKYAERIANALEFEKKFDHRIKDYHFEAGSVVLMRDSAIAKSLNSKAAPR